MAQYNVNSGQAGTPQALATTAKTIINLTGVTATLRRAWIYELVFGSVVGAPAAQDCEVIWELIRTTSVGTGTAATPSPLDAADSASGEAATVNITVEPTFGVSLDDWALNQRNTQRWVARDDKSRIVVPATNTQGVGLRAKSTFAVNTTIAAMKYDE